MEYKTWMAKISKFLGYFQMINDDDIMAMRRQRAQYKENLKRTKHPTLYKILHDLSLTD